MRKVILLLTIVLAYNVGFAQSSIQMTLKPTFENAEIQDLMMFENVDMTTFTFKGAHLSGKNYIVTIDEFKDGQQTTSTTLFDSTEDEYFKISGDSLELKLLTKLESKNLKIRVAGKGFASRKFYFKLLQHSDNYASKDFLGRASEISILTSHKQAILAILTPTVHADGSASYCEVVQSNIAPETLGRHFKIPHYFIISIKIQ